MTTAKNPPHSYTLPTPFSRVPLGWYFECNGNLCQKTSSRTAILCGENRRFYFRQSEICNIL